MNILIAISMHCMCVTDICFPNTVLRSCLRQYILGLPAASDIVSVIFFNFSNIFYMLNSHYRKPCIIYILPIIASLYIYNKAKLPMVSNCLFRFVQCIVITVA